MGVETSFHIMLWSSHVFQEENNNTGNAVFIMFSWTLRSFSAAAQTAHLNRTCLPYISVTFFIPVAEEPEVERRIHILDFLCKTSIGNLNETFQVETANPDLLYYAF